MIRQACFTLAFFFTAYPAFAQITPVPPIPAVPTPHPMQFRFQTSDEPASAAIVPPGTWWRNADTIKALTLTQDQQKKMDDTFRQNRIQLIHMKASLEEEQLNLEPLLSTNPPDTGKALNEISRIADLRADLEKANAKMLLGLRAQLSADQWTKLQMLHPASSLPGKSFFFKSGAENSSSTSTACPAANGSAHPDCTITTVIMKVVAGRRITITCTQNPGETAPRCTTRTASSHDSSFLLPVPRDGASLPPDTLQLDLPSGPAMQ